MTRMKLSVRCMHTQGSRRRERERTLIAHMKFITWILTRVCVCSRNLKSTDIRRQKEAKRMKTTDGCVVCFSNIQWLAFSPCLSFHVRRYVYTVDYTTFSSLISYAHICFVCSFNFLHCSDVCYLCGEVCNPFSYRLSLHCVLLLSLLLFSCIQ